MMTVTRPATYPKYCERCRRVTNHTLTLTTKTHDTYTCYCGTQRTEPKGQPK